ncbi:MAG: hypothetical protein ACYC5M_12740 [Anaerolineae bacterium]
MSVASCWYCQGIGTSYEPLFDAGIPGALEPTEERPCGFCQGLGYDLEAHEEALTQSGEPSGLARVCDAQGAVLVEEERNAE